MHIVQLRCKVNGARRSGCSQVMYGLLVGTHESLSSHLQFTHVIINSTNICLLYLQYCSDATSHCEVNTSMCD